MSWWLWLLTSIGMYIAVGVVCACIEAYRQGVEHSKENEPDTHEFVDDSACIIALWPLFALVVWMPDLFSVFGRIYEHGKTRPVRKLAKEAAKGDALKELCDQHGWDYKKIKAVQSRG